MRAPQPSRRARSLGKRRHSASVEYAAAMNADRFRARYGPWALIAGGSEGIGEAFAFGAAARGLNLVLVARKPQTLEDVAGRIRKQHGVEVRTEALDLAAPDLASRL